MGLVFPSWVSITTSFREVVKKKIIELCFMSKYYLLFILLFVYFKINFLVQCVTYNLFGMICFKLNPTLFFFSAVINKKWKNIKKTKCCHFIIKGTFTFYWFEISKSISFIAAKIICEKACDLIMWMLLLFLCCAMMQLIKAYLREKGLFKIYQWNIIQFSFWFVKGLILSLI